MTDEAMSPLRRRMIEDMTIASSHRRPNMTTCKGSRTSRRFLAGQPDTASFEDVRRYQLHLATSGVGVPTSTKALRRWRFFFRVTLRRHDILEHTHFIREPRKLPVVLSPEEWHGCSMPRRGSNTRPALSVAYGAGLRAAEVVSLKIGGHRQQAHGDPGRAGQGRKDRYVMLSPYLLELLRAWWKAARPARGGCFPGVTGCNR